MPSLLAFSFRWSLHVHHGQQQHHTTTNLVQKPTLRYFSNNNKDAHHETILGGDTGVYVDLGSINNNDDGGLLYPPQTTTDVQQQQQAKSIALNYTSIEEWRSKHWIVLIDDEPSIRLAIGDYLFANGYSVVSACDGPMAFLEVLLWSCSYSLYAGDAGGGDIIDEEKIPPPWIDKEKKSNQSSWRLPNCIISDIRMPGGIDGVQLLELLRRLPDDKKMEKKNDDNNIKPSSKNQRKRGRQKRAGRTIYDEKDEFDLMDAIVNSQSNNAERITTPLDQASQYIDAIRGCIEYHQSSGKMEEDKQKEQYPNSFQQIPVVLLTAKAMVSDRIEGYRAGASGYLPKPFRPEELLSMIDNLMRKQEREFHKPIGHEYTSQHGNDIKGNLEGDLTPEEAKDIARELAGVKKLLQSRLQKQGSIGEAEQS